MYVIKKLISRKQIEILKLYLYDILGRMWIFGVKLCVPLLSVPFSRRNSYKLKIGNHDLILKYPKF